MSKLSLLLVVLAACELQPAPPPQAAPPTPTPSAPPPAPTPPPASTADAGAPNPQWSEGCRDAGTHIAAVIINTTSDPAQRSIYEQDREKMVRAMAETCTAQAWSDLAVKCYIAANTQPDLKACEKKYTPVPTPPPSPRVDENTAPLPPGRVPGVVPAGAGSGSAKGSAATPRPATPRPATPRPATGSGSASGSAPPRR